MIFHITGLKEDKQAKHTIDILVEAQNEASVRDFLTHHGILILSVKPYKQDSSFFGKIFFIVPYKGEDISVTCYLEDIQKTATLFTLLGFTIKDINFNGTNPKISDEEVKTVIANAKKEAEDISFKAQKEKEEEKRKQQAVYEDEKLQETRQIIDQVFFQIKEVVEKANGKIGPEKVKQLLAQENELNKVRMGRNTDKMEEILKKIITLIGEVESEYLNYMEQNRYLVLEGSTLSNIDIIMENERYKKAKRVKQLGGKKDKFDNYYIFFGELGMHAKFLRRDVNASIKNIGGRIKKSYTLLSLAYFTILICIGLYMWFAKVTYALADMTALYLLLINMAIRGFAWYFASIIKSRTIGGLLLLIPGAVAIHAILYWVIINNFAL